MSRFSFFIVAFLCLVLGTAAAYSAAKNPAPKEDEQVMNGISFKDYADFQKDWKLVTVRYRKDTGELRFTYANDKAWKALLSGSNDYPDGAVFAKIGLVTQEDPAFTSSAVPSGKRRYQLMVRDHKKYAETGGWGYALFDMNKKKFKNTGTDEEQGKACDACHQLVPERGLVFSQPMALALAEGETFVPDVAARIKFETVDVGSLPPDVMQRVPPAFTKVRRITGPLSKYLFQGTIDEIRPTLIRESVISKLPAVLAKEGSMEFSIVYPVEGTCQTPDRKDGIPIEGFYTIVMDAMSAPAGAPPQTPSIQLRTCASKTP